MNGAIEVQAGETTVRLSHPGKVLFPDAGITKAELADYYLTVADTMLPHLRGRPIAMERYPDGISGRRIFQKDVPAYFPDWVRRVTVDKEGGTLTQVVCENAATLVYLADLACITPHAWLSRTDRPEWPDQLIFDLDPPGDDFVAARAAALAVRSLLDELDLPSFVKTTGQRGIHVTVPLDRSAGFDAVRSFARDVARELVARHPTQLTLEQRKDRRGGRLYLDLMRNGYAQTAVPPYAVRAWPPGTVATPLHWEELSDRSLRPAWFTLHTVPGRIAATQDPWATMDHDARNLADAGERIRALGAQRSAKASS
jgi:bifunctional non-homologous end joining protein LigD